MIGKPSEDPLKWAGFGDGGFCGGTLPAGFGGGVGEPFSPLGIGLFWRARIGWVAPYWGTLFPDLGAVGKVEVFSGRLLGVRLEKPGLGIPAPAVLRAARAVSRQKFWRCGRGLEGPFRVEGNWIGLAAWRVALLGNGGLLPWRTFRPGPFTPPGGARKISERGERSFRLGRPLFVFSLRFLL